MARIELGPEKVVITLSLGDEVLSLHGAFHIPYTHIASVSTQRVPDEWYRGFKIGTNIPGVKTAGTFISGEGTIFYDFHDPERCLTLNLTHEIYRQVVIQVDRDQEPATVAAAIRQRAG